MTRAMLMQNTLTAAQTAALDLDDLDLDLSP